MWDFIDDRFFKKLNDSDATQFSLLYPKVPAHCKPLFYSIEQRSFSLYRLGYWLVSFQRASIYCDAAGRDRGFQGKLLRKLNQGNHTDHFTFNPAENSR